jgi:hypothetical protein
MLRGIEWAVWRPGRRPGWAGAQLGRRWELIRHSQATWTLRFVDADGAVSRSRSGPADEIAAAIRGEAITGQARRRLREALERADEIGIGSTTAVAVN